MARAKRPRLVVPKSSAVRKSVATGQFTTEQNRAAMAAAAAKPGSRPRSGPTAQPKVAPINRVGTISPPLKPTPTHRAVRRSFTAKAQGSVSPATARSIMCAPAPA